MGRFLHRRVTRRLRGGTLGTVFRLAMIFFRGDGLEPGTRASAAAGLTQTHAPSLYRFLRTQCLTILGRCRRAMKPTSRLLIIEMVLPAGDTPHLGKLLDMMMLVGPGGQERTADEYRDLLGKAGLKLSRVVSTASAVSIVEATLA